MKVKSDNQDDSLKKIATIISISGIIIQFLIAIIISIYLWNKSYRSQISSFWLFMVLIFFLQLITIRISKLRLVKNKQ